MELEAVDFIFAHSQNATLQDSLRNSFSRVDLLLNPKKRLQDFQSFPKSILLGEKVENLGVEAMMKYWIEQW